MSIPTDITIRWMANEPVAGVAFTLNDEVLVTSGPHSGERAWVVSLLETTPQVVYSIELEAGADLLAPQASLVGLGARGTQDVLARFQRWYAERCDGTWEHSKGIVFGTLDNPGWSLKINLHGTGLEHKPFTDIHHESNGRSWVACRVTDGRFEAFGGPHMLGSLIDIFLKWAEPEVEGTA